MRARKRNALFRWRGSIISIFIVGGVARSSEFRADLHRTYAVFTSEPAFAAGFVPQFQIETDVLNLEESRRDHFCAGSMETWAATMRQPSGKRTQTWLCRPRTVRPSTVRSNSRVMLPKSHPKVTMSSRLSRFARGWRASGLCGMPRFRRCHRDSRLARIAWHEGKSRTCA